MTKGLSDSRDSCNMSLVLHTSSLLHCCGLEGALPLTITLTPASCLLCIPYFKLQVELPPHPTICMGFYDAKLLLSRKMLYIDLYSWFGMIFISNKETHSVRFNLEVPFSLFMKDIFLLCHAILFLYLFFSLFKPVKLKTLLVEYNDM